MRLGDFYYGFRRLLLRIRLEFLELRGRFFDIRHRVETSGQMAVAELDIPDSLKVHAGKYQPANVGVFLTAMNSIPMKNWADFAFVDYGCGKGRALLLATQFDFGRIVGIDLSEDLTATARRNSNRFMGGRHKDRIKIQTCASVTAELPRQPSVYFFYNPFDEHVMSDTLRCIDELLVQTGCEAYAVYIYPRHKDVLAAYGFTLIESGMKYVDEWIVWHRPAKREIAKMSSPVIEAAMASGKA